MPTQSIPVKLIDDPKFNSRLFSDNESEIPALAASIKARGLLQPIVVTSKPDGRFELVAGSRRLRAVNHNGSETIEATVKENDEQGNVIDNAIENVQRKDLSTYELARTFAQLRSLGLSLDQVAAQTGYKKQRIIDLTSQFMSMPDKLKDLWAARDPLFTAPFLAELHRIKDPDEKQRFYNERKKLHTALTAGYGSGNEPDSKSKTKKSATSVSVKLERYETARRALQKAKEPIAVAALDYLIGKVEEIPEIIVKPEPKTKKEGK